MTELIFVYPGMKVNGQYNRDVLLSLSLSLSLSGCCQRSSMLQAIRLSFNKTTLHLIVTRTSSSSSLSSKRVPCYHVIDVARWQHRINCQVIEYLTYHSAARGLSYSAVICSPFLNNLSSEMRQSYASVFFSCIERRV